MRVVRLSLAASILVTGSIAAAAVEMTRPFEVLEQTRRAMIELDQRQRREGAERVKREKEEEARRSREEAAQRKRERDEKARQEVERKRDAAAVKTDQGARASPTGVPPAPAAAPAPADGSRVQDAAAASPATRQPPGPQSPVATQDGARAATAPATPQPAAGPTDARKPQGQREPAESRVGGNQGQDKPKEAVPSAPPAVAASTATPGPAAAPAVRKETIAASRLRRMNLYNARGDKLGDVERVLQSTDGTFHIVIGAGGFLGFRERDVRIPLDRVTIRGDRLVARDLTDDQVKVMPVFDRNDRAYRDLARNATVPMVRDQTGK
jgi:hypothetical protein